MGYPIGIDLGTTNSVASVYRRGQAETIPIENRSTMPSAISILPDGSTLIGMQAKSRTIINPAHSITSAKRFIGIENKQWEILGKIYTPVDVSRLIVKQFKKASSQYLDGTVTDAVITVPAYFNNNQKRDTKMAAEAAGLNVIRLLPEPTAAAISYGLDKGKDQTIMVYDLGGGTFDVSILEIQGNRFKVIAVDGDFELGGDDFDLLLMEYLINILKRKIKKDFSFFDFLFKKNKKGKSGNNSSKEMLLAEQQLKEIAEKAKMDLSESDTALIQIPGILGVSLEEEITINKYNSMIAPLVNKTVDKIKAVLKAAKLSKKDIDRLILVGGSTRNRLVKQRVAEAIKEPYISDRVDEVVSHGAAIVAGYLCSPDQDLLPDIDELTNVTPFSLGVCALEEKEQSCYINSIIISKDNTVPCIESKSYQLPTLYNQDNKLEVYMLQGEDKDPIKCLMIGKYIFSNVTHVEKAPAVIKIEYGYDHNGIITVKAQEKSTSKTLPLTIESVPDNKSWLEELKKSKFFDPSSLKFIVTPPDYDNIGKVLKSMNLTFHNYKNGQKIDCDIFFLNCGTKSHPSTNELREFVLQGGCLYGSCLNYSLIESAFPGKFNFSGLEGKVGTTVAEVVDKELKDTVGKKVEITFDTVWVVLNSVDREGEIILRSEESGKPLMVMVPIGQDGRVFFTCFHNHKQISETEEILLQLLVMKQMSLVSGIPIEMVKAALKR